MTLVSVPAGHFFAYPIAYTLDIAEQDKTASSAWTDYFVPFFGVVETSCTGARVRNVRLKSFAVGAGTVTSAPPIITQIAPKSTTRGSSLTIEGYQFGASQGSSVVRIGNLTCDQIVSWTDNSIAFIVPDTAISGAVTVVTDTWTSTDSVAVTVLIPPVATGVSPSSGKRGAICEDNGAKFWNGKRESHVRKHRGEDYTMGGHFDHLRRSGEPATWRVHDHRYELRWAELPSGCIHGQQVMDSGFGLKRGTLTSFFFHHRRILSIQSRSTVTSKGNLYISVGKNMPLAPETRLH